MSTLSLTASHFPADYRQVFGYRPMDGRLRFTMEEYGRSRAAKTPVLLPLHERVGELARLPENWDGHGSARANAASIEATRQLIEEIYSQSQAIGAGWHKPHTSVSEDGEIVLEWWNVDRKLTIYVTPENATYIKSWGPHVINDMEDGILEDENFPSIWCWLFE